MSQKITKKNGIHSIDAINNEFGLEPDFFEVDGEKSRMSGSMIWCDIFDDDNFQQPPYFYLRAFGENMTAPSSGIIRYGSDCTKFQEPQEEINRMLPGGIPLVYSTIEGDPENRTDDEYTYEIRPADGSTDFLCRLSSKYIHVTEGDFLDLSGEWFPSTMISFSDTTIPIPYMIGYTLFEGKFRGKEVKALGGMDRFFRPAVQPEMTDMFQGNVFVGLGFAAVNQDDSREWGVVYWTEKKGMCFYAKDGQKPQISTNVNVKNLKWEKVPYLNDDTVVFTQAVFEVPDQNITIHFKGKYGRKGQGAEPDASPGVIQTSGSWYEEHNDVERKYSFGFGESIGAFGKDNLDEFGKKMR